MDTKAECEHCAYAVPKDEVAGKSINDWTWPDDWQCQFMNIEFWPDGAHWCADYSDCRKVEVLSA